MFQDTSNALRNDEDVALFEESKSDEPPATVVRQTANELRSELRRLIQASLVRASGVPSARMHWLKYQSQVVLRYGVEIEGWPKTIPFKDPSETYVRRQPLEKLILAWKEGHAKFTRLIEADLFERREQHRMQLEACRVANPQTRVDAGERRPQCQIGQAGLRRKPIHYSHTPRHVEEA
ncbi:hypothetical protein EWM64_g4542 [Hericium alpestre]|uniref:Uncharacterized protein n=1 Tax=Hericium alpestre TaxID=135208 RepID=A0A4Y9ZZ58_9AGAM|nr:hypothetical protein EWM64_g4542 [Hericium alpestre]